MSKELRVVVSNEDYYKLKLAKIKLEFKSWREMLLSTIKSIEDKLLKE